MKATELITKLQTLPPDTEVTEIDAWKMFNDNSVALQLDAKLKQLHGYLATGDLDGLRVFIETEEKRL